MEGRDEGMEADVTMQQDDKSTRTKSEQVMEDRNDFDLEQVIDQLPSHVKKTYIPTKQVNNPLPIDIEPIELVQPTLVYIFLETYVAYTQHGNLKQITFFFEQIALVAQAWPQIVDSLVDLKTRYNSTKSLFEDTNNQLQAHCLELVSTQQALQNREKELANVKAQNLKLLIDNKHLVTKIAKANKAIEKIKPCNKNTMS